MLNASQNIQSLLLQKQHSRNGRLLISYNKGHLIILQRALTHTIRDSLSTLNLDFNDDDVSD